MANILLTCRLLFTFLLKLAVDKNSIILRIWVAFFQALVLFGQDSVQLLYERCEFLTILLHGNERTELVDSVTILSIHGV